MRVSEIVGLRWEHINLLEGYLVVKRLKGSRDGEQVLYGEEIRALRRLKCEYPDSPFVFVSERGGPLTDAAVQKIVKRGRSGGDPVSGASAHAAPRLGEYGLKSLIETGKPDDTED